jgi:hypothetical protein
VPKRKNPAVEVAKDELLRSFGPSDSSDSGSDLAGLDLDSATDRQGTGERASVGRASPSRTGSDIIPDRVVNEEEAGLGGGLDQAEEGQLGTTDEELEEKARKRIGED